MFTTLVSITATDPEVWIRLVTSRNASIHVILYQEDDSELYDERLNAN